MALLTDLYQLTMAYGYWQLGIHEQEAVFHLIFRKNPFKSNYALTCGLGTVIEFLQNWRFDKEDLAYLATLHNPKGEVLFSAEFLDYLAGVTFSGDVDAIPEGTIAFAHEPLMRIQGPLMQCQLIETALLNMINFQTLIATKASRVYRAASGDPVIEFGMRRAQGPDGALSASRAAYIGGCVATSNTLAGKLYDIPVRGTHAHSWVTAFPDELSAFSAYAEVMPHNCVLLVDTFDTIQGVKNAIEIGKKLRMQGADLLGIRLDSGDMAELSIKARTLLDEAGFQNTQILASNSLNEYVIDAMKQQGAKISAWGVGTNLVTSYDQPALDGVYKLSALREKNGSYTYKLKLSEQAVKISNPGRHQIRRFFSNENYVMDVIYDIDLGISDTPEMICLDQTAQAKKLDDYDAFFDLLQPVFRQGKLVAPPKSIHQIREQAISAATDFCRMHDDAVYSVGLEKNLHELKQELIHNLNPKK
jgi:nicotinate phosphoribosyltransferase